MYMALIQNVKNIFTEDIFPLRDPAHLPGSTYHTDGLLIGIFEWLFITKLNLQWLLSYRQLVIQQKSCCLFQNVGSKHL